LLWGAPRQAEHAQIARASKGNKRRCSGRPIDWQACSFEVDAYRFAALLQAGFKLKPLCGRHIFDVLRDTGQGFARQPIGGGSDIDVGTGDLERRACGLS
jgi:hypothetical protein